MRPRFAIILSSLMTLTMVEAHPADTALAGERLLVGKTNIFCLQAPCPWRGVSRAEDARSGPAGLLWSDELLPELDAAAKDARQITAAWSSGGCVMIDGRLDGETLQVYAIVGACS